MKSKLILKTITAFSILALLVTSCKKADNCQETMCPTGFICDNGNCVIDPTYTANDQTITKSGAITSNETWSADNIYELAGKVIVENDVILTIEPGTIIKGRQGQGSLASALIIARGAQILANGTRANPIIFTSILDNIKIGEKTGTNLSESDAAKWGGLILLGNARISAKVGDTEAQIEGIPADESYGKYGGNDNNDNSGIITYVSIRHGGALIGEGNEINGLTLGGVGSGTTIDHVEIMANLDDGIECFGGTVNINHALVAFQKDDAFDIDQNFAGSFNNSVVVYDNTGDEFLEIDGPENSTYSDGLFTFENCSFISKTHDGTVDMKSKAQGVIKNCHFEGLTKFKVSAKYTDNCTLMGSDAYTRYIDGRLVVKDNATDATLEVYTKSQYDDETICPLSNETQSAATTIFEAANNASANTGTGADMSEFTGWTWAQINGKI